MSDFLLNSPMISDPTGPEAPSPFSDDLNYRRFFPGLGPKPDFV